MRGCVPWIVIVVVAAHSGDAAAQFFGPDPSVRAELYRVSGGELDSGAGSGADDRNAEGRVCLNTGTYIFAVEAHGEFAGLGVWQAGKMNPSPSRARATVECADHQPAHRRARRPARLELDVVRRPPAAVL